MVLLHGMKVLVGLVLLTLSPTKGYQLKMNAADVLVYPDVDAIVLSDEENEVDVISYEKMPLIY